MHIRFFRRGLLAALLSLFTFAASAQTGAWSGKLDIQGTSLMLIFHLDDDACTLDVPAQGAKGIPAEKALTPEGKVRITVPTIGAVYEGFLLNRKLMGQFTQGTATLPLTLAPGAPEVRRPQTPVGPFSYSTEEVSFDNGSAHLCGTLTLPEGCSEQTPVLLMVTGSGLQNRDEELFDHRPFAVIAHALANAGIATLRYDDRGAGESTGDVVGMSIDDLKADAQAGLDLLRQRFSRVGIIGHSEGGSIALLLAAEGKVDFAVTLAGAVTPLREILLQQNEYQLRKAGFPDEVVQEFRDGLTKVFDAVVSGEPLPRSAFSAIPEQLLQGVDAAMAQFSTPYMRSLIALDVSQQLPRIACPVLAFNGTRDIQVPCESNLSALRSGLPADRATIVPVEGANHLLQHCTTGDVAEYGEIEETIAPEVLQQLVAWLQEYAR